MSTPAQHLLQIFIPQEEWERILAKAGGYGAGRKGKGVSAYALELIRKDLAKEAKK